MFRELFEAKSYNKVKKIIKQMVKDESVHPTQADELYDLVVDEYLDMEDNPNDASRGDIGEIYDASMEWPDEDDE